MGNMVCRRMLDSTNKTVHGQNHRDNVPTFKTRVQARLQMSLTNRLTELLQPGAGQRSEQS